MGKIKIIAKEKENGIDLWIEPAFEYGTPKEQKLLSAINIELHDFIEELYKKLCK